MKKAQWRRLIFLTKDRASKYRCSIRDNDQPPSAGKERSTRRERVPLLCGQYVMETICRLGDHLSDQPSVCPAIMGPNLHFDQTTWLVTKSAFERIYIFLMCHKYVQIENQNTVQTNFERLQLQLWFSDRSAQKNTATKTFWMRFTVEGYKLKSRVRKFHVENRIEIHHAASVLERFPGLDVLQTKLSISFRSIRYVSLDRSTSLFGEVVSG